MGLIVDTCIFIQAEKQNNPIDLRQWREEIVYISAITASELLVGVHRADTQARRLKRTAFVEAILLRVPVLDFTLEAARIHAELYAQLTTQGNIIGAHDLIIAATALAHDYTLITNNHTEFRRVPGLKIESG